MFLSVVEFTYCPVDSMNMVKSFDDCYNTNRKVIKDNHPLTIMANQKRKVRLNVEENPAVRPALAVLICDNRYTSTGFAAASALSGTGPLQVEANRAVCLLRQTAPVHPLLDFPHVLRPDGAKPSRVRQLV